MTEKLPHGYEIDESDVDIIVLKYFIEVVANYPHNAIMENIIFDAKEHKKKNVPSSKLLSRAMPARTWKK